MAGDGAVNTLKQLLALLWPYRWWVILAVLLNWGVIGSSIGLLMSSAYVISRAALQPSIADLQVAIVGIRLFGILRGLLRYLERLVSHSVHFKLLSRLRLRFYQAIEPQFPAGMSQNSSGELHQQVISDMETLKFFFIRWLAPVLSAIFVLFTITLLLSPYDPRLPLITALFFILSAWGVPLLTSILVKKSTVRLTQIRSELHLSYVESLQGMSDLLTNSAWQRRLQEITKKDRQYLQEHRRIKSIAALQENLIHLLMMSNVALALWLTIPHLGSGSLEGFYLAVIALGIMASFEAVQPLPAAAAFKEQSQAAWKRIHKTMNPKNPMNPPSRTFSIKCAESVIFENVHFSYGAEQTLDNLSFEVKKGEQILMMGPSGEGKSTLINLLMQFYQPQAGKILINGLNPADFNPDMVRRFFAVAHQNAWLFNESIYWNLTFGDESITLEEIKKAAEIAQIQQLIEALPQKYETNAGELGFRFSGGERQRLAIARALLKKAPMLILDEPAANLDIHTEKRLLTKLAKNTAYDQIWTISHRIVDPAFYTKIFILKNGKIIESGSPIELLNNPKSLFSQYWQAEKSILG
jgi:ATP-binding cassette, subfamily C, bacterial CydC